MVDQSKRRTIKLMSGASALTIGGAAFLAPASSSAAGSSALSNTSTPSDNPLYSDSLKIQIISGVSTPEDTVVFINDTDRKIVVREFLPRFVTYENHMMDMNAILQEEELTIMPNYPVASKLVKWELLTLTPTGSYLWGDNANKSLITPHMGVIDIYAAVVNGQALLTLENNLDKVDFS